LPTLANSNQFYYYKCSTIGLHTHLALRQPVFLAAVFSCYTNQQQIIITVHVKKQTVISAWTDKQLLRL